MQQHKKHRQIIKMIPSKKKVKVEEDLEGTGDSLFAFKVNT